MKETVLISSVGLLAALLATSAAAQEVGRVISSTPIVHQVAVPRQVCAQQPVAVQQPNSGAGAVLGAVAGGAMGNAIGDGSGRAAATVLGIIGGAMLGNQIEGSGGRLQSVPYCNIQTGYESRTVGYRVTYEYAGRQYTVQMPHDPGPTIPVQVTPVGVPTGPADYPAPVVGYGPPLFAPAPPAVFYRPAYRPYPPVGVSLHLGYTGGHRRHSHGYGY